MTNGLAKITRDFRYLDLKHGYLIYSLCKSNISDIQAFFSIKWEYNFPGLLSYWMNEWHMSGTILGADTTNRQSPCSPGAYILMDNEDNDEIST